MKVNDAKIRQEIAQALDRLGDPLRLHGGDIELVDVNKAQGEVKVRLHGACVGCPLSEITLKHGIESALKEEFAWLKEVVAVE